MRGVPLPRSPTGAMRPDTPLPHPGTMGTRVAINGFGRIGRQLLRQVHALHPDVEVVAVNSRHGSVAAFAQLLAYDSVYGRMPARVVAADGHLRIDGRAVRVLTEPDPSRCPWAAMAVDVVVEATGAFTRREQAAAHLRAGARKVLITAPSADADLTAVVGVNDDAYDAATMDVVSAASCTTNCLGPLVSALHADFGIVGGMVTTIHAYTRGQELHDALHEDPRRGRAAGLNMTPTDTGAARAIDAVLPALAGRLVGIAVRVPVPAVSLLDLTVVLQRPAPAAVVNAALVAAALEPRLQGILAASDEPLVSSDYLGDRHSCTVDLASTRQGPGGQIKVLGWYDNEAGYVARLVDLVRVLAGVHDPVTLTPVTAGGRA